MPLSEETRARVNEAAETLYAVCREYSDVMVVLDIVTLTDIANFETDSDSVSEGMAALPEEAIRSILWHLGKHVGGSQTSNDLLPTIAQFALDEHERRQSMKK